MIKTLQRKFIAIAMAATSVVLFLIIGGINVINYVNVNRAADTKLNILASNQGTFPEDLGNMKPELDSDKTSYGEFPDSLPETPIAEDDTQSPSPRYNKPARRNKAAQPFITAETPYDTRYFTVTLNEDGTIYSTNTGNISAVSSSEAGEYATALAAAGKTSGFVDHYKYCVITAGTRDSIRDMYIFLDCERELSTFRIFLLASIGISAAGILLVFLLVFLFSRKALKPIEESYYKQKRFITDASHELKTPLTIIEANTEILEMTEGETEWTSSIRKQIARLSSLTEKLVFLSRMDEENSALTMLDFSLSDAIEETAEPFISVARTHNRSLDLEIAPHVTFHGDEAALRQMISLLLDNAVKYSSEPGEIRLKLETAGRNKIITLWNTVDEITPGNLDELFDRFYRRDSSRSQKTAGHGIGLSVVQAIVLAHKGKVSAKSTDGRSILFQILL